MTRFDDLEEVHAEVKLKQSLWEAKKDWVADYESWMTVSQSSTAELYQICTNTCVYTVCYVDTSVNSTDEL